MSLRRYAPLAPSRGTTIPAEMRVAVLTRDRGCVGRQVGFPTECRGALELDHVRASGGLGMKSATEPSNLVSLCGECHRWKTAHGREARPKLLAWLGEQGDPHDRHVDPVAGCSACYDAVPR